MRTVAGPSRYWRLEQRASREVSCPENKTDIRINFENSKKNGCYGPALQVRASTDRQGPYKYHAPKYEETVPVNTDSFTFLRQSVTDKERLLGWQNIREFQRQQFPQLYPRQENTVPSGKNVVRNGNYTVIDQSPIAQEEEEAIPVDMHINSPEGFLLREDGTYRSFRSTLSFRIRKINNGEYTCVDQSFFSCAINAGKSFRDDQNLSSVSSVVRTLRLARVSVANEPVFIPRVTEYFSASGFGTENVYFTLTTLDPRDGSVIRIEAVARDYEAGASARVMYQVFESISFQNSSSF